MELMWIFPSCPSLKQSFDGLNQTSRPPTCGGLHRRVRVVERLQSRGLVALQEALSVLRVQPQVLSFVEDRVQGL